MPQADAVVRARFELVLALRAPRAWRELADARQSEVSSRARRVSCSGRATFGGNARAPVFVAMKNSASPACAAQIRPSRCRRCRGASTRDRAALAVVTLRAGFAPLAQIFPASPRGHLDEYSCPQTRCDRPRSAGSPAGEPAQPVAASHSGSIRSCPRTLKVRGSASCPARTRGVFIPRVEACSFWLRLTCASRRALQYWTASCSPSSRDPSGNPFRVIPSLWQSSAARCT